MKTVAAFLNSSHGGTLAIGHGHRQVPPSKPVFARTSKQDEIFYVRANNTTRQLGIAEAHEYISTRWSGST